MMYIKNLNKTSVLIRKHGEICICLARQPHVLNGSETRIELALRYDFVAKRPKKFHENFTPGMFNTL